ncbi:MAG TPA: DUF192 domain-containing protein [Planctomycetota bacterium]|nr:DUF192 domain-containing protein [Planctomycetota bacterium]
MTRALGAALLAAAAIAVPACGGTAPTASPGPGGAALVVVPSGGASPGGALAVARVEIAADPESRTLGLMHRTALAEDSGMLFVYRDDAERSFWMKGTRIPLAAAFLDASGTILNIEEMKPPAGEGPDEARTWSSRGPARFVLEMDAGWFAAKGIRPGDRADLSAALRGVVPR